jgi:hypothetical protein
MKDCNKYYQPKPSGSPIGSDGADANQCEKHGHKCEASGTPCRTVLTSKED